MRTFKSWRSSDIRSVRSSILRSKTNGCFPAPEKILCAAVEGAQVDFDTAHLIANATVARNLYKKATGSGPDAVNASKFWLSCRAGWQKTVRVEATGPDGGPIESKTTMTVNKFEEVARRVADEV